MRTIPWAILSVVLSTNLLAQKAVKPPATVEPSRSVTTLIVPPSPLSKATLAKISKMTSLFDGKTLDGWIQAPPYVSTLSGDDIADLPSFAKKLSAKSDAVSSFISDQLDEAIKTELAAYSPASTNTKAFKSALVKNLNRIDFERLTLELQAFEVTAPVIATPSEIVRKFFQD